jgi:hypothetical protein
MRQRMLGRTEAFSIRKVKEAAGVAVDELADQHDLARPTAETALHE